MAYGFRKGMDSFWHVEPDASSGWSLHGGLVKSLALQRSRSHLVPSHLGSHKHSTPSLQTPWSEELAEPIFVPNQ